MAALLTCCSAHHTCCSAHHTCCSTPAAFLMHEVPGRARFFAPALKGDHSRAAELSQRLIATPLAQTADVSAITGSVVVTYDRGVATRDAVFRALGELGYAASLPTAFSDAGRSRQRDVRGTAFVAKAVLHFILDHALESAVVAVL
jgi:Heavy metal associated domain 2